MNKDELKKDYPELYAELVKEGVIMERDRVLGHIKMAESSGAVEFAHECITKGDNLTDQVVMATYMSAGMVQKDINDRASDNLDDDLGVDDTGADDAQAADDLLRDVMARSKRTGGAIDPGKQV